MPLSSDVMDTRAVVENVTLMLARLRVFSVFPDYPAEAADKVSAFLLAEACPAQCNELLG